MMFHNYFSHIQETQNSKKCLSESENCPHPIFFQKVVIKGSEIQWHGGRIKVGHVEGTFFCSISFSKIQIFPILLSCFVPTG